MPYGYVSPLAPPALFPNRAQDGQSQGLDELRVITGKGLHSTQHVAKIKPAIEQLMVKYVFALPR